MTGQRTAGATDAVGFPPPLPVAKKRPRRVVEPLLFFLGAGPEGRKADELDAPALEAVELVAPLLRGCSDEIDALARAASTTHRRQPRRS